MNYLAKQAGLSDHIECDSAGTSSYHIGSSPDQRMTLAAKQQGIVLQGQARQFQVQDFQAFDLILAMDQQNYQDILRLDRSGQFQDKVRLICDFCTTYADRDVPDPYYGGADSFVYVLDLLSDACAGLMKELA